MTPKRPDALSRSEIDPLDVRAARVAALDALARCDRASADLRRKLLDKGYDPTVVEEVVARLCEEKLVDDRRFLENFIGFHAARGQGPLRVRLELRRLGLPADLVEEGLSAYPAWLDQLRRARQKKFGTPLPTDYPDRQRQTRFLGYRGFTGAQIRLALGFDTDIDTDAEDL